MTTVGSNCHLASAKEVEDKSYLSAVGPDRELGLYFRRCQTFLPCGSNQEAYRVCYYGMTAGAEPQTTCWRNTPAQNFLANALRLIRRLRCGGCDMASIWTCTQAITTMKYIYFKMKWLFVWTGIAIPIRIRIRILSPF
jgi:hypothetical protein